VNLFWRAIAGIAMREYAAPAKESMKTPKDQGKFSPLTSYFKSSLMIINGWMVAENQHQYIAILPIQL
jgi:hypothetical protein